VGHVETINRKNKINKGLLGLLYFFLARGIIIPYSNPKPEMVEGLKFTCG